VRYNVKEGKLYLGLIAGELEGLVVGKVYEGLILCNSVEVHEKVVGLRHDGSKKSKFASVIDNEDGYLVTLGPKNHFDLRMREVVSGQFARGKLEFDVEVRDLSRV